MQMGRSLRGDVYPVCGGIAGLCAGAGKGDSDRKGDRVDDEATIRKGEKK